MLFGLTYEPASLWDLWDGTLRRSVCFGQGSESWNLGIIESLNGSQVGDTKSVIAEGKTTKRGEFEGKNEGSSNALK